MSRTQTTQRPPPEGQAPEPERASSRRRLTGPLFERSDPMPTALRTWHRSNARLFADIAVMVGAMALVGAVRGSGITFWTVAFAAIAVATMACRGAYSRRLEHSVAVILIRHVLLSTLIALMVITTARSLAGTESASLRGLLLYFATGTVALGASRLYREVRDRRAFALGYGVARTLIVGEGGKAELVARRLRERPDLGMLAVGYVTGTSPSAQLLRVDADGRQPAAPVLGGFDDLPDLIGRYDIDAIIVAFISGEHSDELLSAAAAAALGRRVKVFAIPRLFDVVNARTVRHRLGTIAVDELRAVDPRSRTFRAKYAVDRIVGIVAVLLMAPMLLCIALAVKLSSPGPVLYRQRRVGLDGKEFDILKFRSMRVAPAATPTWSPGSGMAPGGVEGDDRRTAVGRFLRRSNLDELPQLLNIARGEMCIVGPRPERPEFVATFSRELRTYDARHRVKAGLTGWAQVNGLRGKTSIADRADWDNYYIENWSFALDLAIVLRTFKTFFEDNE